MLRGLPALLGQPRHTRALAPPSLKGSLRPSFRLVPAAEALPGQDAKAKDDESAFRRRDPSQTPRVIGDTPARQDPSPSVLAFPRRSTQGVAAGSSGAHSSWPAMVVDQVCDRLFSAADQAAKASLAGNGDAVEGQREMAAAALDRHAVVPRCDPKPSAGESEPRSRRDDGSGADRESQHIWPSSRSAVACSALRAGRFGDDGFRPRRLAGESLVPSWFRGHGPGRQSTGCAYPRL